MGVAVDAFITQLLQYRFRDSALTGDAVQTAVVDIDVMVAALQELAAGGGIVFPITVAQGGTGANNAADARTNLGLGNLAVENSPLAVTKGGTGLAAVANQAVLYASSANVIAALGPFTTRLQYWDNTGALVTLSGSTGNRLLKTNGSTFSFSQVDMTTDVTGTLPVANGGTGGNTQALARTGLGLGAAALLADPIPVGNGGTNATTAANARTNLGCGTAATQNTGTSGANVPLLNGTNTWSAQQTLSAALNLTSGQIVFPATQSASAGANTLDDYEEGTFTMSLTDGTNGYTMGNNFGFYTKIGDLVSWQARTSWSSIGSAGAGQLLYTTLPFSTNSSANYRSGAAITFQDGLDTTATLNAITVNLANSATAGGLNRVADNAASVILPANSSSATGILNMQGQYKT